MNFLYHINEKMFIIILLCIGKSNKMCKTTKSIKTIIVMSTNDLIITNNLF